MYFDFFSKSVPLARVLIAACLTLRESLKKTIRRERRRDFPVGPPSLADLAEKPGKYRKTRTGDRFLLLDEQEEDARYVVFATRRNLTLLAKSRTWFVDGTFKTSQNIFSR